MKALRNMKARRPVSRLFVAAMAALLAASGCSRSDAPRHVVLITIDTLRDDHVGVDRGGKPLTPSLDRIAADGIRYTDAITNSTVTRPAHASILTGLYPWHHGIPDQVTKLGEGVATLATVLGERGFLTAGIVSSYTLRGLSTGFEYFHQRLRSTELNRPGEHYKSPEETTRIAADWVKEHAGKAFFLWVHYFPPHGPYTPPDDFIDAAGEKPSGETLEVSDLNYEEGAIPMYQALPGIRDPAIYRSRYEANVRYVDFHVGAFVSTLRELGMYENALLLVTADHGESLGEHDWYFAHGNLVYDEQAKVPLLVKLPGNERAGSVVTDPVETLDIAPTVLALLNLSELMPTEGRSLLGDLESSAPRLRFSQTNDAELVCAIEGRWKFTLHSGDRRLVGPTHPERELYDRERDPAETTNLVSEERNVARRLEHEIVSRFDPRTLRPSDLTEDEIERLRSLGYVR